MNKRIKGFIYLMLSAVFFGIMPLLVKQICTGGGNAVSAMLLRFLLVLPPLAVCLKIKKVPMGIDREELVKLIKLAVFGYGLTGIMLYSSYSYMPSGMATVIHFGFPVFVLLGGIIFYKKSISRIKVICVLLCTGGIFMSYAGSGGDAKPMGFILALVSGMTYAFYILYLENSGIQSMPAFKMIFYMNIIAAVMTVAGSGFIGGISLHMTGNAWIAATLLSLGATFIGVDFFQRGVLLVGAQDAAILSTFEPVTSMIVGILVLHERASTQSMAGCVLILVSVAVTAVKKE